MIDFITLKNFINLYFSATKNPAIQLIKKIPVEQIRGILNLEGFRNAKNSGESVSDYVLNVPIEDEFDEMMAQEDEYSYHFKNNSHYRAPHQEDELELDEDLFNFNNHPRYENFLNLLCDLKPRQRHSQKNAEKTESGAKIASQNPFT